jgi:CheY-like chemotaxis protein
LHVLSDGRPDLIVTDLSMPVMDGATLCLQLKGDAMTANIPIIV